MNEVHGTRTVTGTTKFKIPATDFTISPLTTATNLYINGIVNGVENPKAVGEIKANEYTKVHGATPYTEFYVDTADTYYLKW